MKTRTIIVWIIAGLAHAGLLLYAFTWYRNPVLPVTGDLADPSLTQDMMRTTVLYYIVVSIWNIFQMGVTALLFSVRNPAQPIPMLNLGLAFMMMPLVGTVAYFVGGAFLSLGACLILCFGTYREMKTKSQVPKPVVEEE